MTCVTGYSNVGTRSYKKQLSKITIIISPTGARFGPWLLNSTMGLENILKINKEGKWITRWNMLISVRYLSALGVGETEMVDEEGGLREEYAEAVTVALQEIDSPEFWEHYHSNPDEAVGAYVESKQSPEQVEMAKKGAKLQRLSQIRMHFRGGPTPYVSDFKRASDKKDCLVRKNMVKMI